MRRRFLLIVALGISCRDEPKTAAKGPIPALLGVESPATIAHLESACPKENFSTYKHRVSCRSPTENLDRYSVRFSDGRIDEIELDAHTEAEISYTFDQAIAAILPDETREILRRSIREYPDENASAKFQYERPNGPWVYVSMLVFTPPRLKIVTWKLMDNSNLAR